MSSNKNFAWLFILAAGILWGSMGIFVDILTGLGFTEMQSAAIRILSAAFMYLGFLAVKDRSLLKIKLCDFPVFFGLGVLSILAMTCTYFLAIKKTNYSVAAILLYTAPVIVSVLSAIFFKEKFGVSKLLALVIAFAGCVLVSGLNMGGIKPEGIFFGLMSGLAYALYSIFGKIALRKYQPLTVSTYAFVFAAFGALFVCDFPGLVRHIPKCPSGWTFVVGALLVGLISAFLPFLLYTVGLNRTEPGKAAIIASVEPLAATVCGLFKGQGLSVGSSLGIVCILAAIVIINTAKNDAK